MHIKVEKWEFDGERTYKIIGLTKCCDEITNSDVITIRNEYENDDDTDYSVKLIDNLNFYDDDWSCIYKHINFCPFCGERINIEIVNTVDKTEEYLELEQARKELWDKCRNTDSKRETSQLQNQIYELDRKINELHSDDIFKEEK